MPAFDHVKELIREVYGERPSQPKPRARNPFREEVNEEQRKRAEDKKRDEQVERDVNIRRRIGL
jgi:hypothetical protein